ncbi:MAG: cellulase-like family protein [Opitutales bacterium]
MRLKDRSSPLAITMWDFSWLERRWPGAGYEDWDLALDDLVERGYNAVRIDAYPHFVARAPEREWTILPCWNQQTWGSPAENRVQVLPALIEFVRKCRDCGVAVGLSAWFQDDPEHVRLHIPSPEAHARIWCETLKHLERAGLFDAILFVDLCNEWPLNIWAPFFNLKGDRKWHDAASQAWMRRALDTMRETYPDFDYTFSHTAPLEVPDSQLGELDYLDFLEPHIWMVQANEGEFYKRCGYHYERFSSVGYENLQRHAKALYRTDPAYWKRHLERSIEHAAAQSELANLPLITTECWGIVDYKDWPLLDWDWVKELCAHGVRHAAATGRWAAIATSNFCGPQFAGMWRDKAWHQELTTIIKSSRTPG